MGLRSLVGSGDRIGLVTLPFVVVGVVLNVLFPAAFAVGGPPQALRVGSLVVLLAGLVIWVWTVVLILRDVPRGRLITGGPYSIVRHPLYTGVALLVLPWAGLLLNTWLGVALGAVLYVASRMFSPAEEAELSRTFGARWDEYSRSVKIRGFDRYRIAVGKAVVPNPAEWGRVGSLLVAPDPGSADASRFRLQPN